MFVLLFLLILLVSPRAIIVISWLFGSSSLSSAYSGFLVPFVGFLFVPWTTLVYSWVASNGVTGLDYLWLGLALVIDLSSYGAGAYQQRSRVAAASSV